jgi:hypothetical protein
MLRFRVRTEVAGVLTVMNLGAVQQAATREKLCYTGLIQFSY